ncbi:MAG: hypothetical protein WCK10_01170, partial [Candidatus Staskawiczbacteria bacterium]
GTSNIMIDISRDDANLNDSYNQGAIEVKSVNDGTRLYWGACNNCSLYTAGPAYPTNGMGSSSNIPSLKLARYTATPTACSCPATCGNNTKEGAEVCDGVDDTACPGLCIPKGQVNECKCPTCGNNVVEGTEECDGTDDTACPGLCSNSKTEVEIWNDSNGAESPWYSTNDPYSTYFQESRAQFIIMASELTAKGFNPGNIISGLSLKTVQVPWQTLRNFKIRIKETTATTTTGLEGGFTTVFPATTISTSGYSANTWQNYAFSTPFVWNGTSNIMIDISRDDYQNWGQGALYYRNLGASNRMCASSCSVDCNISNIVSTSCANTQETSFAPSIKLTRKETNTCECSTTIGGSCSVSPTTGNVGAPATWTATATGGTGTYSYIWSGMSGVDSLSGTGATITKTYTTPGVKTGSVRITSGDSYITVNCSNSLTVSTLTLNAPTQAYCGFGPGTGNVTFSWNNTGTDTQTGYQIQVASDLNDFMADGTCTDCEVNASYTNTTTTSKSFPVVVNTAGDTRDNLLHYAYVLNATEPINYYWRLRVSTINHPLINTATWYYGYESRTPHPRWPGVMPDIVTNTTTDKLAATPFNTADTPYPYVYIEPKETPLKFTGNSAKAIFYDYDWSDLNGSITTCYNRNGTSGPCSCINRNGTRNCANTNSLNYNYNWWFTAPSDADSEAYIQADPTPDLQQAPYDVTGQTSLAMLRYTYTNIGSYKAILKVCYGAGCCSASTNIKIGIPSPTPVWQEVSPLE